MHPDADKADMRRFLACNPFPNGLTDGLFYREKMRAIHRVAPAGGPRGGERLRVLEVGGGRSGLASYLYPAADIVTLDIDPALAAQQPANAHATFVCGDACALPFEPASFDIVTLFDVLEHLPDDAAAVREARRVVRPGGTILASTPNHDWHYPYFGFMRPVCPPETDLMREWGHVRRGYTAADLTALFGAPPDRSASFINAATSLFHDIAFSRLGRRARGMAYALAAPMTLIGYLSHRPAMRGSETAYAWRQ